MSCTIKSIEQRLRNSNPELADQLTEKALGAWNTIKESKLFERVGNSFMANMPGTKKRNAQDRLIDELNGQSTATIKSGVEELFDSNPELANEVYSKILTNSGLSAENVLSLLLKDNIIEKQCS